MYWMLTTLAAVSIGSVSAFFLISLDEVTHFRQQHPLMVWTLPLSGALIGWAYHQWGNTVKAGNNLIIQEYHQADRPIPFRLLPMVLLATLLTHLSGGSAGREGTAVQMGAAVGDQIGARFGIHHAFRKGFLIVGISAGFASVFGTPLAGAIFALEVLAIGQIRLAALLPALYAAILAHYTCLAWGAQHTAYPSIESLNFNYSHIFWVAAAGVLFGLTARLFSLATQSLSQLFEKFIPSPPLRPVLGGLLLALLFSIPGSQVFMGLGIPGIELAFEQNAPAFHFLIKLGLTALTLAAGFKGGEVTPIFFIGATLGSALFIIIPLPLALLAALGFAAVFAGATHTPIASTLMAIELFGPQTAWYFALACAVAYAVSGHKGIYHHQPIAQVKPSFLNLNYRSRSK